ncbi:MAG: hypothetical protein ACK5JT_13820 [Hyphomicrobiaceae bacterium]
MVEPRFADEEDLPRTVLREKEAREREAREREMAQMAPDNGYREDSRPHYAPPDPYGYDYPPSMEVAGTVTQLKIPFVHLMFFFIKAVFAAIPALILLTVLLWGMGQGLKTFFPDLRQFEIIVKTPRS